MQRVADDFIQIVNQSDPVHDAPIIPVIVNIFNRLLVLLRADMVTVAENGVAVVDLDRSGDIVGEIVAFRPGKVNFAAIFDRQIGEFRIAGQSNYAAGSNRDVADFAVTAYRQHAVFGDRDAVDHGYRAAI